MSGQYYPRWIPNPSGGKEVLVRTPEEHMRVHPKDYDEFQAELEEKSKLPTDHSAVALAKTDERERCARIAETFPKSGMLGRAIAQAIRGASTPAAAPEPPPVQAATPAPVPQPQVRVPAAVSPLSAPEPEPVVNETK